MLIVLAALKFFFLFLTASWFCKVLTDTICLDCTEAAFKFRIEQNTTRVIGIKTVIIVKEKYNVDSVAETSSTKNLEQGRTKDKNQTVAINT